MDRFIRCIELFGKEGFKKLQEANILILGVGGVGSFALECLYKSGVQNITIIDFDRYETSNLNRQLGSEGNIGEVKVEALKKKYPNIKTLNQKINKEFIEQFDFSPYDIVIDAIDDTKAKIELALRVHNKLIMSLGSAKRIDFSKIEIANSIFKTHGDRLAKKIRYELKKRKFNKKFDVVFSSEEPKSSSGSFMGVTGAFGLAICSLVVQKILKEKDES